jgi:hypothetical protein
MVKQITTCDLCKNKTEENRYKAGYQNVELKAGQYNYESFDLCPVCLKRLGLLRENNKEIKNVNEPSVSDKLFDLISEIVQEAMNQ